MTLAAEAAEKLWNEILAPPASDPASAAAVFVTLHEFVLEHEAAMLNAWAAMGTTSLGTYARDKKELLSLLLDEWRAAAAGATPFSPDVTAILKEPYSCQLRLLMLLEALEDALSTTWGWAVAETGPWSPAKWQRPTVRKARSLHGTDYQICPRHPPIPPTGHSLEDVQWLTMLSILPLSLDGARLQVHSLWFAPPGNRDEHSGVQPAVRIGVWPIGRELAMCGQYTGKLPSPHRGSDDTYGVYRIKPPDDLTSAARQAQAETVLEACARNRIDVVLIPELTSSAGFVKWFQELLGKHWDAKKSNSAEGFPWLVVCGSYHDDQTDPADKSAVESKAAADPPSFRNRCVVLTGDGCEAKITPNESTNPALGWRKWLVDKRHQFKLRRQEKGPTGHYSQFGLDHHAVSVEPSRVAEEILVVDTPIGRVWVTICLDFLKTAGRSALPRYAGLADWILVPAASTSTREFQWRAKDFANTSGTTSIMANACWLIEQFSAWDAARAGLASSSRSPDGKPRVKWKRANGPSSPVDGAVVPPLTPEVCSSLSTAEDREQPADVEKCAKKGAPCCEVCRECLWIAEVACPDWS
ncbi:hypothetical protein [Accumulibacter sp.]|uniref:hypothetical protein n=1 Tax=Accumulibacter sp. TaxID=2053492 RepID=UPI0025CECC63|nr:hypothetical protein [Accumulibacter sp.]MCM8610785.1 hypothetical protein [Accumulibacter sp.]MCM8634903.1 hypothetical protein [Accumulibacter sp.]MCM8638577.1 hypothetical protein [Accumulibacter sp.]